MADVSGGCVPDLCRDVMCGPEAQCSDGQCVCNAGFASTDEGCIDVDECADSNGGCEDVCTNTVGGFSCACGPGFVLADSARDCVPEGNCPGCRLCGDIERLQTRLEDTAAHHRALTDGVSDAPIAETLPEDTNGVLEVGIHADAFPVLSSDDGVFVAASRLGLGRVVVFSGQDFLSSGTRSTLLRTANISKLVTNAVGWVQGDGEGASPRVLAANATVREVLRDAGMTDVSVAEVRLRDGLLELRDWSAEALEGMDVAVVQVNEWGTLHLDEADVANLRTFVMNGGGLLIGGSALHWSWWLDWTAEQFQADALLAGTGIRFQAMSVRAVERARTDYAVSDAPVALFCAYVQGEPVADRLLPRVGALMVTAAGEGHHAEVNNGLRRMNTETPPLPASRTSPKARLAADVGALLRGHAWPEAHPWAETFPGSVDPELSRDMQRVKVDTRLKRVRPLGLYAPPGEVVRIQTPEAHVGTGLRIQLGERYDDNRTLDHIERWRRPPLLVSTSQIDAAEIVVGHGFGGTLYLVVPDDYIDAEVELNVFGAVTQAVYRHGETTAETFRAALAAGVPRAVLQNPAKVQMEVPTEAARRVTDPGDVMSFWTGFYDSHAALSGEPTARDYETHWLFDVQVGWGYANATSRRINYPPNAVGWALRTQTGDEDWWLFAHELGHQFQTEDWSGGDITEVAVNLFSMYTINRYLNQGGDRETRGFKNNQIDHAALASAQWDTADLFGKLELYRQLVFEFGWPVFERVFESYYDSSYPRSRYGGFMDGFAIRFSAISGQDITPFLIRWSYPMSPEARTTVQGFGLPEWLPPGW